MADYYDDRQAYKIHTAVGEVADPEIGSFGPHSGRPKLRGLRPTREGSEVDGRCQASLPSCHTLIAARGPARLQWSLAYWLTRPFKLIPLMSVVYCL
ncbi:Hypothetical predicted protein [Pelobates cultripes]|uniref:Uncharacterized protein n=1 Tax=Pelobates cultripes TaxID=61616 RepID=A0AAD1VYA5_PELCU|nr:Hypothetical predicted protein [Pelobates cultripes]